MTHKSYHHKESISIFSSILDVTAILGLAINFIRQDSFLLLTAVATIIIIGTMIRELIRRKWIEKQNIIVISSILLASIAFSIYSWSWISNIKITPVKITIVFPKDSVEINGDRFNIKGYVSQPNANVSVIVRPFVPLDYWVQEPPIIDGQGNWQINAHFGDSNQAFSEQYIVQAIATYDNFIIKWITGNLISIGKRQDIPNNANKSNTVVATRKS